MTALPADVSTLDERTRALVERGAKEAFGVSLDNVFESQTEIA